MIARNVKAIGLAAAVAVGGVVPASVMATATKTGRHTVTTEKVNVYEQPAKSYEGVLYKGESFDVKKLSSSGKYAYGTAYGHVNKTGWVSASALAKKK